MGVSFSCVQAMQATQGGRGTRSPARSFDPQHWSLYLTVVRVQPATPIAISPNSSSSWCCRCVCEEPAHRSLLRWEGAEYIFLSLQSQSLHHHIHSAPGPQQSTNPLLSHLARAGLTVPFEVPSSYALGASPVRSACSRPQDPAGLLRAQRNGTLNEVCVCVFYLQTEQQRGVCVIYQSMRQHSYRVS